MSKKLKLSEEFINKLIELPESGMGYQKVSIQLKSGLTLRNKTVYNSEFLVIEDGEEFNSEDILNIQLDEK